jgi:acetolactate synthase-1/2/3 large subunit
MRRVGEVVVEALKRENVRFWFGLPGGDSMKLFYDDLYGVKEIKTVLVRHEQSAPFMAIANSRLTGQPSVCHATTGPGTANMVSGIIEARHSCAPVIAIVPCLSRTEEGKGSIHEVDSRSIFEHITKWSVRVDIPEKLPWYLRRAFSIACNGKPGPVFIEIPTDIKRGNIPKYTPSMRPIRYGGDPERVKDGIKLILKSERPIIVAGGGAILSRAFTEVPELAEMLAAPIFTSPAGRGIVSEDHPLAVGQVGLYRDHKIGERIFNDADLLISIGCHFESLESASWQWFPPRAKMIQIDIDSFEIGRNWIPDVAIVGDAKLVLADLIKGLLKALKMKRFEETSFVKELMKTKKEYEAEIEKELSSLGTITGGLVVRRLSETFGKDTILANENAALDLWSYYFPYYKVLDVGPCVGAFDGFNCMGAGVAGAIAAKITVPQKKAVCTTGDGAFQMLMHELPTAVQYEAPATFVVFNNFALGWVKFRQKQRYEGRFIDTTFEIQPDFAKVAEACKCYGERIEKPIDVATGMRNALKANKDGIPAVLDVIFPENWWDTQPKTFLKYCDLTR